MKKLSHKRNFFFLLLLFSNCLFLPNNLKAAQVLDSMHYGWAVYEYQDDDQDKARKKCYIATTPYKSDTSYTGIRNPYLSITRYAKKRSEEISIYSGYEYKISSNVNLLIGDMQKTLFTKGDSAWANNGNEDKEIIKLMLNNEYIKVRSDSSTGNYAIDEYETKGLARAYARMKKICQ